jgi:hypothetical protein
MDKRMIILLTAVGAIFIGFLLHNYVFSIYETVFHQTGDRLYPDGRSKISITAVPINALGLKALFRSANTQFTIEEGADLVDVIENDEAKGVITIQAKMLSGKVVIYARPKYALFPTRFEIVILPNMA